MLAEAGQDLSTGKYDLERFVFFVYIKKLY